MKIILIELDGNSIESELSENMKDFEVLIQQEDFLSAVRVFVRSAKNFNEFYECVAGYIILPGI